VEVLVASLAPLEAQLSFPADTAYLNDLGLFIRALCHRHAEVVLLELTVTEMITNAIRHAGATWCKVTVLQFSTHSQIIVSDNGQAFNPLLANPQPLGQLHEGGYGIAILHSTAESLNYVYETGWNQLTLSFPLQGTRS
jgi:anti-sigma regulatory factor (Ser/Thr protein kinase)